MPPFRPEMRDALGRPVPESFRQVFWARWAVSDFADNYHALLARLDSITTARTPEWEHATREAHALLGHLWLAAPYCVCPYCPPGEPCDRCGDKRWLTEREYRLTETRPLICEESPPASTP